MASALTGIPPPAWRATCPCQPPDAGSPAAGPRQAPPTAAHHVIGRAWPAALRAELAGYWTGAVAGIPLVAGLLASWWQTSVAPPQMPAWTEQLFVAIGNSHGMSSTNSQRLTLRRSHAAGVHSVTESGDAQSIWQVVRNAHLCAKASSCCVAASVTALGLDQLCVCVLSMLSQGPERRIALRYTLFHVGSAPATTQAMHETHRAV